MRLVSEVVFLGFANGLKMMRSCFGVERLQQECRQSNSA